MYRYLLITWERRVQSEYLIDLGWSTRSRGHRRPEVPRTVLRDVFISVLRQSDDHRLIPGLPGLR